MICASDRLSGVPRIGFSLVVPASSHRCIFVGLSTVSSDRMAFCHHSLASIVVDHLSFDADYFQHLDDPDSLPQPESIRPLVPSLASLFGSLLAFATRQRHRSESQSSRLPT